jgi:methionine biosynthesis protein MetW
VLRTYLDSVFRATEEENRRTILEEASRAPGGRLLDLGCGDGSFTMTLARRNGAEEIVGVEFVARLADQARERGVQVEQADLTKRLPFPDRSFDVVHSNQVIEHMRDTDHFLRESCRVLRAGGTLLLSTNNLASWHNVAALALGWQPLPAHVSDEIVLGNPIDPYRQLKFEDRGQAHLRLFTARGLRELAVYHGLRVTAVRGVGYYPFSSAPARFLARVDSRHAAFVVLVASPA